MKKTRVVEIKSREDKNRLEQSSVEVCAPMGYGILDICHCRVKSGLVRVWIDRQLFGAKSNECHNPYP